MTKDFCDRCGELIPPGKWQSGDVVIVEDFERKLRFQVEVKILLYSAQKLCIPCAEELIDEAHGQMISRRKQSDAITA